MVVGTRVLVGRYVSRVAALPLRIALGRRKLRRAKVANFWGPGG
jgi:hypothetical protein